MSLNGEATDAPITVKAPARFLGVSPLAGVCLRRAKADSPLPHDGPLDPLPTVGTGRVAPAISCKWRNR